MSNEDSITKKLGLILEQVKITDAEIQKMIDNGEYDAEKLGKVLQETDVILEKLSVKKLDITEALNGKK